MQGRKRRPITIQYANDNDINGQLEFEYSIIGSQDFQMLIHFVQ